LSISVESSILGEEEDEEETKNNFDHPLLDLEERQILISLFQTNRC